jgi:hypothetical protein
VACLKLLLGLRPDRVIISTKISGFEPSTLLITAMIDQVGIATGLGVG